MPLSRSEQMARIRSQDTKPEMLLRKALWSSGLRYRLQYRIAGVRSDLAFPGAKVAVFVDGCQWHGCPEHYVAPKTRVEFWQQKLATNVERDERQTASLRACGWNVLRFWEHEVWEDTETVVAQIRSALAGDASAERQHWQVFRVEFVDTERRLERRHMTLLGRPESIQVVEAPRSTTKWKMGGKSRSNATS